MRHIQIYEEYSDEELQDLMGDLKSVGQTPFKPQLGKDYGWTSKLLEKNPGLNKSFPSIVGVYFTPETVNYMIEKGMASYEGFADKEKSVGFKPAKEWASSYGSYGPGFNRMDHRLNRTIFSGGIPLYQLWGFSGDYGFGTSNVKAVGKKARNHCQNQFLEKFKNFTDKEGHL